MPRTGVSKEAVIRAAEKIVLSGEHPTVVRVREVLGNTGSHSTISKHLSDWRQFQSERHQDTFKSHSAEPTLLTIRNPAILTLQAELKELYRSAQHEIFDLHEQIRALITRNEALQIHQVKLNDTIEALIEEQRRHHHDFQEKIALLVQSVQEKTYLIEKIKILEGEKEALEEEG